MENLNSAFNQLMDIGMAVAIRLADIPFLVVYLVVGLFLVGIFVVRLILLKNKVPKKVIFGSFLRTSVITLGLLTILQLTQKIELLLRDSREVQFFTRVAALSSSGPVAGASQSGLIDSEQCKRNLTEALGPCLWGTSFIREGFELGYFQTSSDNPIVGWVAILDLSQANLKIRVSFDPSKKTLSSLFAHATICAVAINGEAGTSPARDAPLGSYVGACVSDGQILHLPNPERPYFSFDQNNRPSFFPSPVDQSLPGDSYNAIWGRGNLLVNGEIAPNNSTRWSRADPRTLVGINESGTRLFLVVIDGRQLGYSAGADHQTGAKIMQSIGASDAMWCDQGGSSSMYLGLFNRVINKPSEGQERLTYSHFGVSFE